MVEALMMADRYYDLIVFPEAAHNIYMSPYRLGSLRRYFVEHLEAPEENAGASGTIR
jgi:hypothetical protein